MAYRTQVAYNAALPVPSPEVDILVGGFSLEALRDMAIWRRLVQADAPSYRYLDAIFVQVLQSADQTLLETIVPPSQHATTALIEDKDGAWKAFIQPSDPQECFAVAVRQGRGAIVMKGIPTEEAWDAFLEALRS